MPFKNHQQLDKLIGPVVSTTEGLHLLEHIRTPQSANRHSIGGARRSPGTCRHKRLACTSSFREIAGAGFSIVKYCQIVRYRIIQNISWNKCTGNHIMTCSIVFMTAFWAIENNPLNTSFLSDADADRIAISLFFFFFTQKESTTYLTRDQSDTKCSAVRPPKVCK